ncbi:subtilisin family serine protease [Bradyrhizobium japonicum]
MDKVFVRFPKEVAHFDAAPAVGISGHGPSAYYSQNDGRLIVTSLTADQHQDALAAGAQVYPDIQFHPASGQQAIEVPQRLRFWEDLNGVGPAAPQLWQTTGLSDVLGSISVNDAWKVTRGEGVTIVVVDSGIDAGALEFPEVRRSPLSLSIAFPEDGPWVDGLGHGSMMAAIAAGSGEGMGRYDGVAPGSMLLSARTNYRATDLYTIYDRLISLKKSGALSGPIVVNNSYAVSACISDAKLPEDHPYAEIARSVVATGIPMCFAAGNNHADMLCGNPGTASAPNTIWAVNSIDDMLTVGAVNWDLSNSVGAHANSSRGPGEWAKEFLKPDLVAPCYGEVLWGRAYRKMEWWGTSGSTAIVSGVAALVLSAAYKAGTILAPQQLGDILRRTCDNAGAPASAVGHGVVNAKAAVDAALKIVTGG